MANYRNIHTQIWKDSWFIGLTTNEKLLFFYLITNELAPVSGIYRLPVQVMAWETGMTKPYVTKVLKKFEAAGKIVYQDDVIWVKNLRRYNATSSQKVMLRIRNELDSIPDSNPIKAQYLEYYGDKKPVKSGENDKNGYPMDTVSIPYGYPMDTVQGQGSDDEPPPDIPYRYPIDTLSIPKRTKRNKTILNNTEEEGESTKSTNWIPETPKDANRHPLIQIYHQVTNQFPGTNDYKVIVDTLDLMVKEYGLDVLATVLQPYYNAWLGKGHNPRNPGWLDWALSKFLPENQPAVQYGELRRLGYTQPGED